MYGCTDGQAHSYTHTDTLGSNFIIEILTFSKYFAYVDYEKHILYVNICRQCSISFVGGGTYFPLVRKKRRSE